MKASEIIEIEKANLLSVYRDLENNIKVTGVDMATYTTPVNFKESLLTPIHRWYGYKEGFSPSFVREFINKYSVSTNDVIFDPFGGVGTTALEAIKMGFTAYQMDVNPLGCFVSQVKTHHYSNDDRVKIKQEMSRLSKFNDFEENFCIDNDTVKSYFSSLTWSSILKFKTYLETIKDSIVKNLFALSLLSLISEISTHRKDGNGVKKKRKETESKDWNGLKAMVLDKISLFVEDIEMSSITGSCNIYEKSNIKNYMLPQKPNIVLTSPPYANCFDYSKVYLSELWIGGFFKEKSDQKKFRQESVSSHVHYKWEARNEDCSSDVVETYILPILKNQKLWSPNICPMIKGYFSDMGKFLQILSRNIANNAVVGIVVGNSVYGATPIATDLILADLAEKIGFDCEQINIYRQIISSSQQFVKLTDAERHYVRESLLVLKWNR